MKNLNPIGSYTLSNTASINIYDIDYTEDKVLAGYNSQTPQWEDIQTNDDGELGFCWGFWFIPFDLVMRVNL